MISDNERKLNELRQKKYLSMKEYCIWRGVRMRAVSDAIENGRLDGAFYKTDKQYFIQKDLADRLWVENADPARVDQVKKLNAIDAKYGQVDGLQPEAAEPSSGPGPDKSPNTVTYNKARAVEKTFLAKLAQIEYNEKIGSLIERTDVEREFTEVAQKVKNAMLNIPSRIMDKIASVVDPYECEKILRKEINEALENLTSNLAKDANNQQNNP